MAARMSSVAARGTSQGDQLGRNSLGYIGLEITRRHELHGCADEVLQLLAHPAETDEAEARWEIDEQVDVGVGPVLAPCDAAEDSEVGDPMSGCGVDDLTTMPADSAPRRPGEPVETPSRRSHAHIEH
jgi:hypothetical protein